MSIRSAGDETFAPVPASPVDRLAFIGNVHRLLALGYARLFPRDYRDAEENLLNQAFVAALRAAVEDLSAPRWAIHFSVHEKRKQNDGQRLGNARFELDIVFERTRRGVHPRFSMEAKRLGPAHPVTTYLGPEGLGAFMTGEYAPNMTRQACSVMYNRKRSVAGATRLRTSSAGLLEVMPLNPMGRGNV